MVHLRFFFSLFENMGIFFSILYFWGLFFLICRFLFFPFYFKIANLIIANFYNMLRNIRKRRMLNAFITAVYFKSNLFILTKYPILLFCLQNFTFYMVNLTIAVFTALHIRLIRIFTIFCLFCSQLNLHSLFSASFGTHYE